MDGWLMEILINGWMDGLMDGWMDDGDKNWAEKK